MTNLDADIAEFTTEPDVISLDLESIKTKAEYSYRSLVNIEPGQVPWSVFAAELGKTKSACAPIAKAILERASQLTDIRAIYPPIIPTKLAEYDKENVLTTVQDLLKLGIQVDKQGLIAPLEDDPIFIAVRKRFLREPVKAGIMEIAAGIQEEYTRSVVAARIYETARIIMSTHASMVLWPKRDSIYYFRYGSSNRDYLSSGHGITNKGRHVLSVQDFFGNIGIRLEEINKDEATVNEYYNDAINAAFHESGHASFEELYDLNKILKAYSLRRREKADLFQTLTEGYAIMYENLGDETLKKMVPKLPNNLRFGPQAVNDRQESFKRNKDNLLAKPYLDGDKIMRRLVQRLGVNNSPRQEQIQAIADFLRKTDIEKVATINFSDKEYILIVKDPLNKLPRC